MSIILELRPDEEARIRQEAAREGISPEQITARKLLEADLLWRIRTSAPANETHDLHSLLQRKEDNALTEAEADRLQNLLDQREERAAERLRCVGELSGLRGVSVSSLMNQLGIEPIAAP